MILRVLLILSVIALLGVSLAGRSQTNGPAVERVPVLVELFTSEGCSSCPPADELLIRMEKEQPVEGAEIIALSQHVDYWNRLGWTDPFSSPLFTRRQNAYAGAFRNGSVYTPQMVVDGREEFVGSDAGRARQAIARAAREAKARVELGFAEAAGAADEVRIRMAVKQAPASVKGQVEVFVAVTEANLATDVRRGENSGRRMAHTGVVRTLVSAGKFDPRKSAEFSAERVLTLGGEWKRGDLRVVVFAQEAATGRIAGAASMPLAGR